MEKTVKENLVFDGRIIKVYQDDVMLLDGSLSKREVVSHNGGACLALFDPLDNKYYMVKQFRYAIKDYMYEFCAGKIEPNEDPMNTIVRECEEELGFKAKDVKKYGYIIPTCGYCNEKIYLYSATKSDFVGQNLDEGENLNVCKFTLSEIEKMIVKGTITDAKTIALVYRIKNG